MCLRKANLSFALPWVSPASMINDVMEVFDWEGRAMPMSRPIDAYSSILVYLAGIFILKHALSRSIEVPTWIAALHNLVLCLGSLVMFLGTAYESSKADLASSESNLSIVDSPESDFSPCCDTLPWTCADLTTIRICDVDVLPSQRHTDKGSS